MLLARRVGIGRGADFVLYVSVLFLLYSSFRIFIRLEKTERCITTLTRQIAIEKAMRDVEESVSRDGEHPHT